MSFVRGDTRIVRLDDGASDADIGHADELLAVALSEVRMCQGKMFFKGL